MPKIPVAHCKAEKEDFAPDDVVEFLLRDGQMPVLQCADEECRRICPETRIASVCCDSRKPCKKAPPHFRTYPKDRHRENCPYGDLAKEMQYVMEHKGQFKDLAPERNLFREIKGVEDSSLVPDEYSTIYNPRGMTDDIERKAREYMEQGKSRPMAYRTAVAETPYETSRLSTVIDICEMLEASGEREAVPLAIPGRPTRNYDNAFFSIPHLREGFDTPYIFYGWATVDRCAMGFIIKYEKPLEKYREDLTELRAVTIIENETLAAYRFRRTLLEKLNHYADSGKSCCVYSFSAHCLNESNCPAPDLNRCVLIAPNTLDALVIRKRCVKRSAKR